MVEWSIEIGKRNTEMQKDTERAQSLGFQRPLTRAAVRKSHCRLLLQGFGHEASDMRQVEKPCLQLGCRATVCDVVRGGLQHISAVK
jgi:hypothetical protein